MDTGGAASNTLPPVSGTLPPIGTQDSVVSTQWLPSGSEVVGQLDIGKLLAGPLGQLLQNPLVAPQIQELQAKTGFTPTDISSVTIGVGGISGVIKSGQKPNPDSFPATVVIRATKNVEASQLLELIPKAEMVTNGSVSYVRVPEQPPVAIWLPDSTTAVVGAESVVLKVAGDSASLSGFDTALLDGSSTIQFAFSPSDPDAIFRHPKAKLPPQVRAQGQATPQAFEMIDTFLKHARGASIGLNLTNDLGVTMAVRSMDAAGAQAYSAAAQAAQEESKAQPAQQVPPMMAPFMALGQKMTDSFKLETAGDLTRTSMNAEGGGQQLAAFAPMVIPFVMQAQQAAQRAAAQAASRMPQPVNNMKEIALAMHNFHDVYQRFPNAASVDPTGKKLLSWRVHLLPFLNHEDLYNQFQLDEPWDSPANRPLADQMPDVYRSSNAAVPPGRTLLQVPIGPGTLFEGGTGRGIRECTDGTSNTILYVPDRAVYWTQPDDLAFDASNPLAGVVDSSGKNFEAVLADGSVRTISATTAADVVKALMTRSGGEAVSLDALTATGGASSAARMESSQAGTGSFDARRAGTEEIGGIALGRRTVLGGKIDILLPVDSFEIGEEALKVKFPNMAMPNLFLTHATAGANLQVNHTMQPVEASQLGELGKQLAVAYRGMAVNGMLERSEIAQINGRRWFVIEFDAKQNGSNGKNITCVTPLENRMLLITFTTSIESAEQWLPIGKAITESFRIIE